MDAKPALRKRALTAEEAELWAHTMRDARALKRRGRGRTHAAPSGEPGRADAAPVAAQAVEKPSPAAKTKPTAAPPPPAPQTPSPKSPPLAVYDEKERRRLGKIPDLIDGRLDLHGLRQCEAHAALRSFLFNAAVRGHRHVLIITGKGFAPERQRDFFGDERGVLRRLVPQWLGEPDLRGIVVSYTTSHMRHGGDGALYVRLRKAGPRRS
jgi:DNA-nicking Smr family endonuclease